MLKILIADAHGLIRKGLIEVLRSGGVAAMVGEAGTGQETLALCASQSWDVIVLDAGLRGDGSLATLAALRQSWPEIPIVMHALRLNTRLARRWLNLGAAAYALKSDDPTELICAIEVALSHRVSLSHNLVSPPAGIVTLTLKNGNHET